MYTGHPLSPWQFLPERLWLADKWIAHMASHAYAALHSISGATQVQLLRRCSMPLPETLVAKGELPEACPTGQQHQQVWPLPLITKRLRSYWRISCPLREEVSPFHSLFQRQSR